MFIHHFAKKALNNALSVILNRNPDSYTDAIESLCNFAAKHHHIILTFDTIDSLDFHSWNDHASTTHYAKIFVKVVRRFLDIFGLSYKDLTDDNAHLFCEAIINSADATPREKATKRREIDSFADPFTSTISSILNIYS